ncbi:MAG: hypothetical protein IPL99_06965 [Candidatus Competibacteraceae bacterium]|nr:hypothetical protein [Candidatus Competibacteraceae bacterium]
MIRIGYCRVPAAALGVLYQSGGGFSSQGALVKYPRPFSQGMLGFNVAVLDRQA